MMRQFEAMEYMGVRYLTVVDMRRYDFMIGFRRIVAVLR